MPAIARTELTIKLTEGYRTEQDDDSDAEPLIPCDPDDQAYAHLRAAAAPDHDTGDEGGDDDGQSGRADGELESDDGDELESGAMEVDTFIAYVYKREKGEPDEQFRIGRIHAVKKELVTVHYCWSAFRRGKKLQTAKWKLWQRNKKNDHLVTFNKEHIITLLPDMRYHEKTKSYYLGSADRKCLAEKLQELDRATEAVRKKRRRTGSQSSNRRTGRIDDDDDDGDDDDDDDDDDE
jgi:hypothetical protein